MEKKIIFIVAGTFCLIMAGVAEAKSDYGISCSSCHAPTSGKIAVTAADTVTDIGRQLDGQSRGALKTFVAEPGSTVTLSLNVLDGTPKYALQLSRLETGGQQNDAGNRMVWSENNSAGNVWTKYGTGEPYFTKGTINDGSSGVYTFDVLVEAGTEADFYDLKFAFASKSGGLWYQEEHFYIQVTGGAGPTISVVNPNGGETLAGGQGHAIQWDSTGDISGVLLEYSTDNGSSWTQIAGNAANSGSYNWVVPELNSNQSLVRVSGGGVNDVSDGAFSIAWTPASPTISGTVVTGDGAGVLGVSLTSNTGGISATTDSGGNYSLTVPYGWSGTITPNKTDYTFSPPSISYNNVTSNITNENYTGSLPLGRTISGNVAAIDGSGIADVQVFADNGGTSDITDASGDYSVTVPYNWSGTIAPSKTDYTFSPPSTSYSNVTSNRTNEKYTGSLPVGVAISGNVETADGVGIAGALVSADNGGTSATTDTVGFYSITVPYGWAGTVTPGKTDYTFNPSSISYSNVTSDRTNEKYTGSLPVGVAISGNVETADGVGIAGVLVSADNGGTSATTDTVGFYSITVPYGWAGIVTPSKTDYTFNPSSISYSNVTSDRTNEKYTGSLPVGVTISGNVETADGIGIASVLVSADNGGTSATTDTAGYYSVTVPYGWSGTIIPGMVDYTFEPADLAYTDVRTDVAGENYAGSAAGYNVADHVFDILLSQIWDYNDQANPDDLKYVFYITLDTDATVESIDILTPAGNSLQIPADAHIVSGNTETWYSNDGGVAVWEYEAGFVDAAGLDGFGDGDYVITIYHDGGIQEQTIAAFSAAGTSDPLPQPTQEPILSNPVANSEIASPVIFTWETCSDAAASVISLELENLSTAQTQAFEFPVDSTSSSVVSLGNGTWQSELSFETSYQYNNADGVNVSMWKYSASTAGFNITQGDSGDSINATFDIDTDGFVYSDDTFNTSLPAYADGTYEANSGYSGGAINVNLGHGKTGGSTSGGWSRSFTLSEPSTVVASLRYRMLMADGYESDEYCEAILAIDGIRYGSDVNNSLVHLAGDGDGTIHDDTGWLSSEFEISLSPGEHTITVGAYNNNATSLQEWVEVFFDDIVVYAADTVPLPDAFIQEQGPDGIVSIEAENFDDNVTNGDHAWNLITLPVGFSGSGAMRAEPDVGTNNDTGYVANSPRLDFNVNFVKTGTHYIWIRGYETDGTDNSCHAGLDGQAIASSDRIGKFAGNQWVWSNTTRDNDSRATFTVNTEGVHTVNVWMREDGFRLDKVVLTTNPDYTPTSNGPAESQRPAPVDSEPPTPDPMTWTTQPNSTGTDSVSMTAATASDVSGVEYYFECVSGGGNDSDWQDSAAYSDTGLSPETEYSYRVKARDKSNQFNETGWSGIVSVITEAVPGVPDDTVTVVTAEYNLGNLELIVEAISNEQPDAVLSLEGYGQMTWNVDKGKYEYRVEGSVDPDGWVTVTSSLGGSTTVSVTYNGEVAVDVVTITKAEYNLGNLELRVEATSTEQPDAVLSIEGYGQMTWNVDKSKYEYRVEGSVDPDDWVTVTSSLGDSTTVSVTYNGEVAVDVVTITKAEYNYGNLELRVEATSTEQPDAVLSLEGYGQMSWNADKNKYEYRVKGSVDPDGWITVTSSLGGSTTISVTYKGEVAVDVVTITKAEYKEIEQELRVEAMSTEQPDAVLTLEGYGQMSWNADKNKYEYKVKGSVDPDGWITVTSNLGGSKTSSMNYRDASEPIIIKKAEYKVEDRELRVEAYAVGSPDAVLTVDGYGKMVFNTEKSKYEYRIKPVGQPGNTITVISDSGNSASRSVVFD